MPHRKLLLACLQKLLWLQQCSDIFAMLLTETCIKLSCRSHAVVLVYRKFQLALTEQDFWHILNEPHSGLKFTAWVGSGVLPACAWELMYLPVVWFSQHYYIPGTRLVLWGLFSFTGCPTTVCVHGRRLKRGHGNENDVLCMTSE